MSFKNDKYLYDKNGNEIKVYALKTYADYLEEFRKKELQKISNPILKAYSRTILDDPFLPFESYRERYNSVILSECYINDNRHRHFHQIKKCSKSKENEQYLDRYYLGYLQSNEVACAIFKNGLRYFLLSRPCYIPDVKDNTLRTMDGIIELPESLYILQLLEQQQYSFVSTNELPRVLELYDLKYVDSFDLCTIEKMDNYGITNGKVKELNRIIPYHQKIIQMKKK